MRHSCSRGIRGKITGRAHSNRHINWRATYSRHAYVRMQRSTLQLDTRWSCTMRAILHFSLAVRRTFSGGLLLPHCVIPACCAGCRGRDWQPV